MVVFLSINVLALLALTVADWFIWQGAIRHWSKMNNDMDHLRGRLAQLEDDLGHHLREEERER